MLAAERLFAEHGIEGVSLRQIGAAAGNGNNSAVQYHFGTKDRLVHAVFEYRLPRLRERRDLLLAERRPDDLRAWVECEARWMFEQSELDDSNYMSFVAMLTQYGRERRVRPATRRPGHVHSRIPRAHLRRCSSTSREPLRTHRIQPRDGLAGARGRRPRACPGRGQPVLPFAVALGDVVDGIVGFLEAPASAETLAALDRADPDVTRRSVTTASAIPRRSIRSTSCDPARYAARGYPDDVWTQLRAEAPVAWFEPEGYEPFWAITKHADILDVASQPVRFSNEHGLMIGPEGRAGQPIEMVVTLDPPRHGPLRRVAHAPAHARAPSSRATTTSSGSRSRCSTASPRVANDGEEFDFVQHVAAPLPIAVIAWFLGVPAEDRRAALPLDQRGDRQGRPRVPPARRDARARRSGGPAWRCTPTSASSSSGAGASPATTSSASSSPPRSTGSRSPRCSCCRTAS